MSTRSAVLARALTTVAITWQTLATVPAGEVWLLKSVFIYNNGPAVANISCRLNWPTGAVVAYVLAGTFAIGPVAGQNCWIVADAGVQLQLQTDQQPVYSWWSGARLNA